MSAQWSLTAGKRTSLLGPPKYENDPNGHCRRLASPLPINWLKRVYDGQRVLLGSSHPSLQCYINMSRELRWSIPMVWNDIFSPLPDAVRKALSWTAALLLVAFFNFAGHRLDLEQSAAPIEWTLQAQAPEAGHSR
jgi:hypothetical protein